MTEQTINLNGKDVELYSYEHLSFNNSFAREDRREFLLDNIEKIISEQRDTDWGKRFITTFESAKEFVNKEPSDIENYDDKLQNIIIQGNMFGLGSAWGVSIEADILWAAAAISLEKTMNNPQPR